MDDRWTLAALGAVALLALWLLSRPRDREGFELDPKFENSLNRLVAKQIRKDWSFWKDAHGFDQPLNKYFEWYGRGSKVYGCNRADADGSAQNYKLCKRWQQLNRQLFKQHLKAYMGVVAHNKSSGVGCNTDGLGAGEEDAVTGLTDGTCTQSKRGRFIKFPACKCEEGVFKNKWGVPVCGGGGKCA